MLVLGKGAWNCAHLDELRGDVLRVGYVFDKFILRGVWTVDFLQPFFNVLGPSLIKQTGPPSVMDYKHVPDDIKRNWCSALNKRNDLQIVMQRTERLHSGGTYSDFVAFSLMWFLVMAQEKLGFKHGDIKRANVMFRKYPTEQVFKFFLDEKHEFMFSSNEAPVFIDFDFSSTRVTETRLNPGTAYTAPPEAIMYYLKMTTVPFDVMVYDWWSLGIYFIELVAPFQVSTIMQEEIVAYIVRHFQGKNIIALNGFYVGILLNQALGYDTLPANWNHMFPSRSLFESPNFAKLKERLNKAIEKHSGLMYLLKYHLLALYSDRRRQGRKYLLHFRPEVIDKRPNLIYSASIDIREKANQYPDMWYLQNCIECREKPAKWEERMDSTKRFCSQLCQISHYKTSMEINTPDLC